MDAAGKIEALRGNIEKVFIGKPEEVKMVLVALFAGGHILIEDVPGVGKTTLAKALARSTDALFQRVQFTPDLLPSDILGVSVYNQKSGEFVFKPGPIFTNVLLADEINRTTPRTQSALLEAMNDFQVSVDGKTHPLPKPFIVLATQNPYEFEGTYPLPESQLDRFLMRISIGYPDAEGEKAVLASQRIGNPLDVLEAVITAEEVTEIQRRVREVKVDESLIDYVLAITQATRASDRIEVGVSPRGSLFYRRAAQALAYVESRDYVIPDDIKRLASPLLAHRIIFRSATARSREKAERVIDEILELIPVPV
ncbi:MAG: AAA family ATPase [Planctomycetota bacterium]|jgi:MoxR-like ATPase